jgi:diguanylate cyclase (GGDEF)-like protein
MGYLYVTSHPGYAYKSFWEMTVHMSRLFGLAAVVILSLGIPMLRFLFKPLNRVEKQAEALCEKHYSIQEELPKTRELRTVVIAMNSMVEKVRQMFDEQADIADSLRENAYCDPLTGLGNRRYLELQIAVAIKETGALAKGALLLAEFNNLTRLNQEKGYECGDLFLLKGSGMIKEKAGSAKNKTIARISGGTFAVLLPDSTKAEAIRIAEAIAAGFAGLAAQQLSSTDDAGSVGGICYEGTVSMALLLSEADRMLRTSRSLGKNTSKVESLAGSVSLPRGEQQWNRLFNQLLEDQSIILMGQKTVACTAMDSQLHTELFARIALPGGELISANVFIPLAERLNRMSAIDKMVVNMAFALSREEVKADELAINISPSSLRDESFLKQIYEMLKNRSPQMPRIVFEFAEFNIGGELPQVQDFAEHIKPLGGAVGIDHFGRSSSNFSYLNSLQPKYVKIDGAFTEEIDSPNDDGRFFLKALTGVAHGIDILVIAEAVENQEQLRVLRGLGIDGVQGFHIEKPRKLERR